MPSGSSAGSSGSSGGGSHFGGGSRGSGSRSGYVSSHRGLLRGRPGLRRGVSVYYIGRNHYMSAGSYGKLNGLSKLLFFLSFFLVCSSLVTWANNQNLSIIINDHKYYQQMILDAEENPEQLQVLGKVTARKRDEDVDKWYLEYCFVADDGEVVPGYTYSIYTWEEVQKFTVGGEILLAVDSLYTTKESDSVNMDYKNYPLESDGEYQLIQRNCKICLVCDCVLGASCLATGVAMFIMFIKQLKKTEEIESPEGEKVLVKMKRYCSYCGAQLDDNSSSCKHCGSAKTKDKEK